MNYYRRPWDETRGDDYSDWGTSTWFFEIGEDGYPARQLELYENGKALAYDTAHADDEFGGLGDQPLDLQEFAPFEITKAQFEQAWSTAQPVNR